MARWKKNSIFDIMSVAVSVIFIALSLRCGVDVAGGSSEIGNGVVFGKVVNEQGASACSTIVRIMPYEYDRLKNGPLADACIDTTNTEGEYRFAARQGHTYSIQAVHITLRTRAMVPGAVMENGDLDVPPCTLKTPGAVTVSLPDTADPVSGYVYIPGSDIYTLLDNSTGSVTLDSVPAGLIPAVSYSSTSIAASSVIRYDVPVLPGDTTVVYNPSWNHARRLFLNTTAAGADVSGNVHNFPVLVRLTTGNFTFNQAKADGGDLRFTKADGSPLRFELSRWDGANGFAEVWVKVDTVLGNNGAQHIIMLWGNPSANRESNGSPVFDSAGGFEGAWHLNETSGAHARDASHNGYTGTYRGGLPSGQRSPTGICQTIARPDSDYVDMGDVLNPGMKNISIGVWFKRGAMGTQQALVAKTNGNSPSAAYGYLLTFEASNFPRFYMATGGTGWGDDSTFDVVSNLDVADTATWHHMFVTIDRSDNESCRMYLDGMDRTGATRGDIAGIPAVANALGFRIGTESDNNCSYTGAIGEVTVAFTARSADWVKLSYMNQKEQDALVMW